MHLKEFSVEYLFPFHAILVIKQWAVVNGKQRPGLECKYIAIGTCEDLSFSQIIYIFIYFHLFYLF